jgi:hypothetical protein
VMAARDGAHGREERRRRRATQAERRGETRLPSLWHTHTHTAESVHPSTHAHMHTEDGACGAPRARGGGATHGEGRKERMCAHTWECLGKGRDEKERLCERVRRDEELRSTVHTHTHTCGTWSVRVAAA